MVGVFEMLQKFYNLFLCWFVWIKAMMKILVFGNMLYVAFDF